MCGSVTTITCINFHQTGSVGEGSDHLQLIKFWPSCTPGICGGVKNFGSALLRPACSVCVSPSAFFIISVFLCEQVCSSLTKQEIKLISVDPKSAASSPQPASPLSVTAQPGSPQRRVVILPAHGSLSPVKVNNSQKCVLLPRVFASGSENPLPLSTAYKNCGPANHTCTDTAVRTAVCNSGSMCISSCVSQCIDSTSQATVSESDGRTLPTTLQVDGIVISSCDNSSKYGIVSVACRESGVQETSVLSPVTSITRLPVPASSENHSASSSKKLTVSTSSGCIYQSRSPLSRVSSDNVYSTHASPGSSEVSLHHAVAVAHPAIAGPQVVTSARTVKVSSIRKVCPNNMQNHSVVVKLFAEHSGSVSEPSQPANGTSAGADKSLKHVVILTSTASESTSGICLPTVLQRSCGNASGDNLATVHQPCPSVVTANLVVTSATKVVSSTMESNSCHTIASCHSQKVTESKEMTLIGRQNNAVTLVGSNISNIAATEVSAENSLKSEDDSDDDSVVIIDADSVPSSPSPSRNTTKRSSAAQNVILLNHKNLLHHTVDSKQSTPKAVVTEGVAQSRTKRKSALGIRLFESDDDDHIILPASSGCENGSRISQPSRRKSFPQRRTDTSIPQLQFCTKQWKRDINARHSTADSPSCKRSPSSRSPKRDAGTDLLDTMDKSNRLKPFLVQSHSQCSRNSCSGRKRKPVDHCESSPLQEVKRSKRLSPVKSCGKTTESTVSVVSKDAVVESGTMNTSLPADTTKTSDSSPVSVGSDTSATTVTYRHGDLNSTESVTDSSPEQQMLGKDKRSMEMSVTNEDGVVENLVVTIIDISSSSEDDDDEVEIHSVSSAKLDSSEVLMPEVENSQSVTPECLSSSADGAIKVLQDKPTSSSILPPDCKPVSTLSCKAKSVRQKCRQTVRNAAMGRKVLVGQGKPSLDGDHIDITKVNQVNQLRGKSSNQKHLKPDAGGTVKQTKADSDYISVGYLGPVVHVRGSKDSPVSCSVVSGARDVYDETFAKLKQKHVVLNSTCYPTSFQLQDSVPWRCIFCHQGSSYRTLGDLFGPYYAMSDSSVQSDGAKCQSTPSKSRSRSGKKGKESSYTIVSHNHRRQLQKYAPPVAGKSPRKKVTSPNKGIPPEIWLHQDCAIWTSGICLSPTGQPCGLEAAITLSMQTVYSIAFV